MKYIRTKRNIYEISHISSIIDHDEEIFIYNCVSKNMNALICIEGKNVINKADTIEELCDEFVVFEESQGNPLICPKEKYEEIKKVICIGTSAKLNTWLKGAIWTDKGLIYVAKINDKGELELL